MKKACPILYANLLLESQHYRKPDDPIYTNILTVVGGRLFGVAYRQTSFRGGVDPCYDAPVV